VKAAGKYEIKKMHEKNAIVSLDCFSNNRYNPSGTKENISG
jgi:hypothetical protein